MVAESIEQMKRDLTDKYVLVDATRPELARFRDVVGRVKTVNMNGRALVEFDDYHVNIGWYDIAPEYLKVVDKPPPKPAKTEAKKPAAKPTPTAKTPGEAASVAGPAKSGKLSVAEMLAAARSGGAAKAGGPAPAKAKPAPAVDKPAAPKVDRSKMSVADMIAAAKAGGPAGSGATPSAAGPTAAEPAETKPTAAKPAAAPKPAAPKSSAPIDKSKMSIDDILAWCREHDMK